MSSFPTWSIWIHEIYLISSKKEFFGTEWDYLQRLKILISSFQLRKPCKKKNPAEADKELLSCRLGKHDPRSSACQERTRAQARRRVTVRVARRGRGIICSTYGYCKQPRMLRASPPLEKQVPTSMACAGTSPSSSRGSQKRGFGQCQTTHPWKPSYFYLVFFIGSAEEPTLT